jgi:DNA-binding NarL/FixJ family response regulator
MGPGSLHRDRDLCLSCHREREAAAHLARVEDVAEMYREGMSMKEIAATLGYGPNSIPPQVHEAFKLGLLKEDEHRYDVTRRENQRLGRERAKAA